MALTLKLDDIKPLAGLLGLGQAPDTTPKPLANLPPPPMAPLPPTPAAAGFTEWKADPANQQKVSSGMTPPNTPMISPNAPAPDPRFENMASMQPPQRQYASMNPPGMTAPTAPAPPASPTGPAPLQSFQDWSTANPDKLAKPMFKGAGKLGTLLNLGAAGTIGAAGGLKGDPTAGANWVAQRAAEDRAVPDVNQQRYGAAVVQPAKDAAALADTQSQTALRTAQGNKANAQADAVGDPAKMKSKQIADAAKLGMIPQYDQAGNLSGYAPDENSPIAKSRAQKDELVSAQVDATNAQKELRAAQTAFENNKSDPKSLISQQVASRLATARKNAETSAGRLNQSTLTYQARYLGTGADNQPLAGSMITDDGQSVGSAFSGNVRPTGTERNKGDMAESADRQLADIKEIMQKNRTMFGPGYGQSSEFKKWIGGQSPDAQRFLAARTIAADHLAGTFGGRSEAALDALDNAIGQFKDNPDAAIAGVDQLSGANKSFQKAGTVRTAGSKAAGGQKGVTPPPTGGGAGETLPPQAAAQLKEGQQHTFNNGQIWTLQNGKPLRVK
jgi:hypothetical protein